MSISGVRGDSFSCNSLSFNKGKEEEDSKVGFDKTLAIPKTLNDFPPEILSQILKCAVDREDVKTLNAIRKTCVLWKLLADKDILSKNWKVIEKDFSSYFPFIKQISTTCSEIFAYADATHNALSDLPCAVSDQELRSVLPSQILPFRLLVQKLRRLKMAIPCLMVCPGQYAKLLKKLQDASLVTMWSKLCEQNLEMQHLNPRASLNDIRYYLQNPHLINPLDHRRVFALEMPRSNIHVLPPELFKLTEIAILELEGNHLQAIPDDIRNLSKIQFLGLADNELLELPEAVFDLPDLHTVCINSNYLTSVSASVARLVNNPQFSRQHRPETLLFYVSDNELTSLSLELGQSRSIVDLNVAHNRLTSIPQKLMDDLCQMDRLIRGKKLLVQLDGNPLFALLDENFLELSQDVARDNFVKSLPLPAELMEDNIYELGEEVLYAQEVAARFSACTHFPATLPLAKLCQAIHRGESDEVMMSHFDNLSDKMKQQIREKFNESSSSSQEPDLPLFLDRVRFTRAIFAFLQEKRRDLLPEQIKQLYQHVRDMGGQSEAEENWGRGNESRNIILLIEALERVLS